jgi:hypothetical protein
MKPYAWFLIGAVGASVLWVFAVAWLIDVIAAQRKALSNAQTTLRLYRETRTDSDATIRDLLDQNTRLARQLIERAAESTTAPVMTVPQRFFHPQRES